MATVATWRRRLLVAVLVATPAGLVTVGCEPDDGSSVRRIDEGAPARRADARPADPVVAEVGHDDRPG